MSSPFLWYRIQTSPGVFSVHEIKAVIFDLDGTLTVPVLDFAKMRSLLGIPRPHDILEVINRYDTEKKEESLRIIDTVEEEGRGNDFETEMFNIIHFSVSKDKLELQPTALDLLRHLEENNVLNRFHFL